MNVIFIHGVWMLVSKCLWFSVQWNTLMKPNNLIKLLRVLTIKNRGTELCGC